MRGLAFAACLLAWGIWMPAWSQDLGSQNSGTQDTAASTDAAGPEGAAQDQIVVDDSAPAEVVSILHEGLLTIMKDGQELGFSGRVDAITPVVTETFDIPALSKNAIGVSTWRSWDDTQKDTYVSAFGRFLSANYAHQFKSFSGQAFEVVETKMDEAKPELALVEVLIKRPSKDDVELTYLTRAHEGHTGIVDVFLGGSISEAARRRSEFNAIYGETGFDGLITSLEQQIAGLGANDGSDIVSETAIQ